MSGPAAEPAAPYAVGSILYGSWGYDQTNIDFFQIVRHSAGGMLTLRPLSSVCQYDGASMTGKAEPGAPSGKPDIRRKLYISDGQERGCKYFNYSGGGWISAWDGLPKAYSTYA